MYIPCKFTFTQGEEKESNDLIMGFDNFSPYNYSGKGMYIVII